MALLYLANNLPFPNHALEAAKGPVEKYVEKNVNKWKKVENNSYLCGQRERRILTTRHDHIHWRIHIKDRRQGKSCLPRAVQIFDARRG